MTLKLYISTDRSCISWSGPLSKIWNSLCLEGSLFTSVTQCRLVSINKFWLSLSKFLCYYSISFAFHLITSHIIITITHPNIVFTPQQCNPQGNNGSYTGPIPTGYSKSLLFIFKCIMMHHDKSILHCEW